MTDPIGGLLFHGLRVLDGKYDVDKGACIAATRVAIEVLAHYGIAAKPLSVDLLVMNAASGVAAAEGRDWQNNVSGGWTVAIVRQQDVPPSKWGGHLVAVTADEIIDLSLPQANRPDRGIEVTPSRLPLTGERRTGFLAGNEQMVYTDPGGITLVYRARPRDRTYTTSPNWGARDRADRARIVGEIIRAIGG